MHRAGPRPPGHRNSRVPGREHTTTTAKTEITAEPGQPRILVTRSFDAPRELLFRAHTDPELPTRWLGPRRLTMTVDRLEPRDGGTWRFAHRDPNTPDYQF